MIGVEDIVGVGRDKSKFGGIELNFVWLHVLVDESTGSTVEISTPDDHFVPERVFKEEWVDGLLAQLDLH